MDLADDPEAMLAGFKKKLRSQVRRGLRETGRVQVGGAELATAFYDIYTERMRDLGSPPHSLAVFEAIAREFPEETRIVVLESEGAPIATGFLLRAGDCAYVPWAATLQAGLPKSLNMALYFELFRTSIEWGAHAFDLGRCDAEGSHLKFKLQWGGEPLPLAWYRIPAHGEIETTPSRDSGMMQRAARMWRRLPLSWTRILGPHVIRHLS